MEPAGSFLKILRSKSKKGTLLGDDGGADAPIRGPLFSRSVHRALIAVFCVFALLTVEWFGLLLLNSRGVTEQMGTLNVLRVTAILLGGIGAPSVGLMVHYRRIYSYTSDGNVFFATTFSISFMMGLPCALVGIFG